jgi:membrane-bound lytic murein transglycosylase D
MGSFVKKFSVLITIVLLTGCIRWRKTDVTLPQSPVITDEHTRETVQRERVPESVDENEPDGAVTADETFPADIPDCIPEDNTEKEPLQKALFQLCVPEVDHVKKCKNYFLNKYRKDYESGLERRRYYSEMIQTRIEDRGMPQAVKWIPMVETWFRNSAVSSRSAAGLWQLMPATARAFGLRVDTWIDERKDPEKSTMAALDYLEYLYERTDCWYLAFAAYHSGEGRVYRAIRNNGTEDYWAMAENREFSSYTRFYVAAIMALALIERNTEKYGISFPQPETPDMAALRLDRQLDLRVFAEKTGISLQEIRTLNPSLKRNFTPPDYPDFVLKIPAHSYSKAQRVLSSPMFAARTEIFEYVIQPGDTLSAISYRFGIPVESLIAVNQLKNHLIIAGKKLLIPEL